MMKLHFKEMDQVVYGTAMLWGISSDIVEEGQRWRKTFGSCRYTACGTKRFCCDCKKWSYECDIKYKNEYDKLAQNQNSANFEISNEEIKDTQFSSNYPTSYNDEQIAEETPVNKGPNTENMQRTEFPNTMKGWKTYDVSKFLFFGILIHEARSSMTDEIFLPCARMNDGSMYIGSYQESGKIRTAQLLAKMNNGGNHITLPNFQAAKATEVVIKPKSRSFFNVDGEIFPNDEVHIKMLPSFINMVSSLKFS